ncbi:hypothetical protein COY87_01970 [Candidatus Roizmanbacteria bacterium CG_4_10_14_0_8_um_filter_33_9]|uniref:Uncharacterized protein n=1 Tax=Candidatus Roizmanbacteria bacterium CG_4_10_14_0_8_um_filter_33_9 TaxID=1974826 RepID=A0A2M7QK05_9BACT|nr:MAG: hypothetical protein COY87_01970 [Candidatus Roizmanbacteria bacterium CG_4_10_14_0_8_um_filter_33_9]
MLPIILCSQTKEDTENYLNAFIRKHLINSTHIYRFIPEKTELTIEEVKSILKLFTIRFPSDRLFIFYRFESTSWEVQNMLLKVLEEKKDLNHIVLITSNLYSLLPTIRSRAKVVSVKITNTVANHVNEIPPLLDFLIENKKRNPLCHDQLANIKKEDVLKYINEFIYYFANKLRHSGTTSDCPESTDPGVIPQSGIPQDDIYPEILKYLFFIKHKIENNNLNVALALDNLLLFIEKKVTINI